MDMFCNQCEQAYKGRGCDKLGVCGKTPEAAGLMDLILHQLKGIAWLIKRIPEKAETPNSPVHRFAVEALFATVTNVNFDTGRLDAILEEGERIKSGLRKQYDQIAANRCCACSGQESLPLSVTFVPEKSLQGLGAQSVAVNILQDHPDPDIRSLEHLLIYGLKGMAAYASHAALLGYEDESVFSFFHEVLAELNRKDWTVSELADRNMRCGQVNLRCMELLDRAHTETFGHPVPVAVSKGIQKGPAIIVSGHDLRDLRDILEQSAGKGISVYTHGEMLPAHGYPGLKKYPHLAGHFGTAWQNQQKEFENIPAAVYFTTNCLQEPDPSYRDRVFTGGMVGWPGLPHIEGRDFSPLIEKALELGGFSSDRPGPTVVTGFARNAVLNAAAQVVDLVKRGKIRRFFLIGGCDGAKPGRNYYTELAQKVPKDCVILTLACGKFRFHEYDFGDIEGIPRLLDVGQCNDAYSAVKIAEALAGAFGCGVNDLPLTFILSWYEQKAVAILLTLLSLGIKGIRLGPTLPAFLTPNVLDYLVKNFDIRRIDSPERDLESVLNSVSSNI